jgi:hypothetical protein
MVEEARKALAEGREIALPSIGMSEGLSLPKLSNTKPSARSFEGFETDALFAPPLPSSAAASAEIDKLAKNQRRFGLSPEKASAIPAHLRTSSVQVEPATPPKWMVEQEAEEKAREVKSKDTQVTFEEAHERPGAETAQVDEQVIEKRTSTAKLDQVVIRKGAKKERPTGM